MWSRRYAKHVIKTLKRNGRKETSEITIEHVHSDTSRACCEKLRTNSDPFRQILPIEFVRIASSLFPKIGYWRIIATTCSISLHRQSSNCSFTGTNGLIRNQFLKLRRASKQLSSNASAVSASCPHIRARKMRRSTDESSRTINLKHQNCRDLN